MRLFTTFLRRKFSAVALKENVILPEVHEHLIDAIRLIEACDMNRGGYKVSFDVQHNKKAISFVTEAMTTREKIDIFLRQKVMMREMYPDYHILETHE
tara:strand:+ start:501 stop:794 length:294 start_codon:yes stop_codon:yes gene_type:complete